MTRHLLEVVISKAVYWKRSGELKTGHLRRQCWGQRRRQLEKYRGKEEGDVSSRETLVPGEK